MRRPHPLRQPRFSLLRIPVICGIELVVRRVPGVVTARTDDVHVLRVADTFRLFRVVERVLIRPVMQICRRVPETADDRCNPATTVLQTTPFAACPHRDRVHPRYPFPACRCHIFERADVARRRPRIRVDIPGIAARLRRGGSVLRLRVRGRLIADTDTSENDRLLGGVEHFERNQHVRANRLRVIQPVAFLSEPGSAA